MIYILNYITLAFLGFWLSLYFQGMIYYFRFRAHDMPECWPTFIEFCFYFQNETLRRAIIPPRLYHATHYLKIMSKNRNIWWHRFRRLLISWYLHYIFFMMIGFKVRDKRAFVEAFGLPRLIMRATLSAKIPFSRYFELLLTIHTWESKLYCTYRHTTGGADVDFVWDRCWGTSLSSSWYLIHFSTLHFTAYCTSKTAAYNGMSMLPLDYHHNAATICW